MVDVRLCLLNVVLLQSRIVFVQGDGDAFACFRFVASLRLYLIII